MIISEWGGHQLSIFDIRGQKIRTFGSRGDSPEQIKYPRGIAIDDADNIYVSSSHKLQKFTRSGELIKCVGQRGSREGEFNVPCGVTLHDNQVYVCDRYCMKRSLMSITCTLLLPYSATYIFPAESNLTSNGSLNSPLPSPYEPMDRMKFKSRSNT